MNNRASALLHGTFPLLLLVFLCLLLPKETLGQKSEGVDVAPEQEKRSFLQVVDGYASLSDHGSLPEAREAALANAKKEVIEEAKGHIAARMKSGGLNETYEAIWSNAEGAVVVLDQKDHGAKDQKQYHVWIMAEVPYDLKPKKSAVPMLGKEAPLTVKVWTPKKEYKAGETMKIYVQGNREFYGRIIYRTSTGEIIQLLPNEYRKSLLFKLGEVYGIPDQGDQFGLTVTAPYGEDRIVVYASEVPLGEVKLEPVGQGLGQYDGSQKSLAAASRAINMTSSDKGVEFYEAVWAVEITCSGPTTRGMRKKGKERPIDMTGAAGAAQPFEAPGEPAH